MRKQGRKREEGQSKKGVFKVKRRDETEKIKNGDQGGGKPKNVEEFRR